MEKIAAGAYHTIVLVCDKAFLIKSVGKVQGQTIILMEENYSLRLR